MRRESNRSNDLQRMMAQTLFKASTTKQFSVLADTMQQLARANKDYETINRINAIKNGCPLDFEGYCRLYLMSFGMPFNRSFHFTSTGRKYRAPEFRMMAERHFARPLNNLMISFVGRLGEVSDSSLNYILEATSNRLNEIPKEKKYNIIFDNDEDLQNQKSQQIEAEKKEELEDKNNLEGNPENGNG